MATQHTVKLTKTGNVIVISTPYNASLVAEIKELSGQRWDSTAKAWLVPASQEDAVRAIVRKYFQIEGEASTLEYETVKVLVRAKASAKRTYLGGVTVDGHDVINLINGRVNYTSSAFEVLDEQGGFTVGDGYIRNERTHAYEAEYTLTLKVRKGATFEATGRADHWGHFKFLQDEQ